MIECSFKETVSKSDLRQAKSDNKNVWCIFQCPCLTFFLWSAGSPNKLHDWFASISMFKTMPPYRPSFPSCKMSIFVCDIAFLLLSHIKKLFGNFFQRRPVPDTRHFAKDLIRDLVTPHITRRMKSKAWVHISAFQKCYTGVFSPCKKMPIFVCHVPLPMWPIFFPHSDIFYHFTDTRYLFPLIFLIFYFNSHFPSFFFPFSYFPSIRHFSFHRASADIPPPPRGWVVFFKI